MSLTALVPNWHLALEPASKSPKTFKSYLASVRSLSAYLAANDMPSDLEDVATASIRAFLLA